MPRKRSSSTPQGSRSPIPAPITSSVRARSHGSGRRRARRPRPSTEVRAWIVTGRGNREARRTSAGAGRSTAAAEAWTASGSVGEDLSGAAPPAPTHALHASTRPRATSARAGPSRSVEGELARSASQPPRRVPQTPRAGHARPDPRSEAVRMHLRGLFHHPPPGGHVRDRQTLVPGGKDLSARVTAVRTTTANLPRVDPGQTRLVAGRVAHGDQTPTVAHQRPCVAAEPVGRLDRSQDYQGGPA